jgi:hypothetical protein
MSSFTGHYYLIKETIYQMLVELGPGWVIQKVSERKLYFRLRVSSFYTNGTEAKNGYWVRLLSPEEKTV